MLRILAMLLLCIPSSVFALPAPRVDWVKITPDHLFTGEEKSLLITAAVTIPEPMRIVLLHLTPDRTTIAHRWAMTDDGTFGDLHAHDGIYSRKVEFKPYKPLPIHFAVYPEFGDAVIRPRDRVPADLEDQQSVTVTVAAQPTFIELLSHIWHTLFSQKEPS